MHLISEKNQHILWLPVQPSETVDRLDDEITEILKEAGDNTRSTAAQTDNIMVNNSTQTDSDLQTELYRTILYKACLLTSRPAGNSTAT